MTVFYNNLVATCRGLGNFGRLLFRWRGSIYKLVYADLLIYMVLYFSINVFYRLCLKDDPVRRGLFQKIVTYCKKYDDGDTKMISFVLSFYVSQIITRWWAQFMTVPWPDALAAIIATSVHGHDERGRLMRRTMMRYINLTFTLTMIMLSPQAKARFPTLNHLVEAGFMQVHEKIIIEHLNEKSDYSKYWIPIIWTGAIANRARKEGRIPDDVSLTLIIRKLTDFRGMCGDLLGYDWVCTPLVYTQVVTLSVYLYFLAKLLGDQFTEQESTDIYFPVFLFLEFFFYMGWLKVAETMINPFGEDDDDFDVNWLIDRNFTVSYLIVDEMHQEHPEMIKDQYWDEVVPENLPYTEATVKFRTATYQGSAAESSNAPEPEKHQNKDIGVSIGEDRQTLEAIGHQGRLMSLFSRKGIHDTEVGRESQTGGEVVHQGRNVGLDIFATQGIKGSENTEAPRESESNHPPSQTASQTSDIPSHMQYKVMRNNGSDYPEVVQETYKQFLDDTFVPYEEDSFYKLRKPEE